MSIPMVRSSTPIGRAVLVSVFLRASSVEVLPASPSPMNMSSTSVFSSAPFSKSRMYLATASGPCLTISAGGEASLIPEQSTSTSWRIDDIFSTGSLTRCMSATFKYCRLTS